ncbi:MAG: aminotransferase class III-fold pyridoxal phosphate-dependent enzyme [Candidatus Micrarchaeaceae archaeon]
MAVRITKKTKSIIERDRKVFLTTTREAYPFIAERGEGDYSYDIEGNRFIDFASFISVYNLGINSNASIRNAIKAQVDKLMHDAFTDYYSELPVKFGEELIKMFPAGFGKLFLSNSGTEANEAALKFAQLFTKRNYNIAFYGAFHGRTKGSLALTASKTVQREHFGPFTNTIHVPFAYCYRCPFNQTYPGCGFACVDYIKKYPLSKEVSPREVSAFFIEPIQGEGGYIVPPLDYFKEIKKITEDNGMLLVADEVQSGYMRTGKFLALDNFGVKADIYTMAKALGAGLPIGATVVSKELGDIPSGSHANTFGGNLVSVAAALASLRFVSRNKRKLEAEVRRKGRLMLKRLKEMENKYEIVGDARGIGLMLAIEIVRDKKSKNPGVKEREKILTNAFYNGLLLLPAGESSIRIIPPLTISDSNIEKGLDILENAVKLADSRSA